MEQPYYGARGAVARLRCPGRRVVSRCVCVSACACVGVRVLCCGSKLARQTAMPCTAQKCVKSGLVVSVLFPHSCPLCKAWPSCVWCAPVLPTRGSSISGARVRVASNDCACLWLCCAVCAGCRRCGAVHPAVWPAAVQRAQRRRNHQQSAHRCVFARGAGVNTRCRLRCGVWWCCQAGTRLDATLETHTAPLLPGWRAAAAAPAHTHTGHYRMAPDDWCHVSLAGQELVKSMLKLDATGVTGG